MASFGKKLKKAFKKASKPFSKLAKKVVPKKVRSAADKLARSKYLSAIATSLTGGGAGGSGPLAAALRVKWARENPKTARFGAALAGTVAAGLIGGPAAAGFFSPLAQSFATRGGHGVEARARRKARQMGFWDSLGGFFGSSTGQGLISAGLRYAGQYGGRDLRRFAGIYGGGGAGDVPDTPGFYSMGDGGSGYSMPEYSGMTTPTMGFAGVAGRGLGGYLAQGAARGAVGLLSAGTVGRVSRAALAAAGWISVGAFMVNPMTGERINVSRRMNPLNPQALRRSIRRCNGFARFVKGTRRSLSKLATAVEPRRRSFGFKKGRCK